MITNKARGLWWLKKADLCVPDFLVLSKKAIVNQSWRHWVNKFPTNTTFAVRSAAHSEDDTKKSGAGYFTTYLDVDKNDLDNKIAKCWQDMETKTGQKNHNVILQKFVQGETSGVLFTANPQGLLNELVIVIGQGSGDGIVNNQAPTTTYYYLDETWSRQKNTSAPELSVKLLEQLLSEVKKIIIKHGRFLDLEFTIKNGKIYWLQMRPITTLQNNKEIILSNHNLIESYPGLSLPLTISHAKHAYRDIFTNLANNLLGEKETTKQHLNLLNGFVTSVGGRLYYRLNNWYALLQFVPLSSALIPIWQRSLNMDGEMVTQKVSLSIWQKIKIVFNFGKYFLNCPKLMTDLEKEFINILQFFNAHDLSKMDNVKLRQLYHNLVVKMNKIWWLTLINDLYAFVFFDLVKRFSKQSVALNKKIVTAAQYQLRQAEELKLESEIDYDLSKIGNNEELERNWQLNSGSCFERQAKLGAYHREKSRFYRALSYQMLRLIVQKMGRNYAEQKIIEKPRDIFYLTMDEVMDNDKENKNYRQLVSDRKNDYKIYDKLSLPSKLVFANRINESILTTRVIKNIASQNNSVWQGQPCSQGKVTGEVLIIKKLTENVDFTDKIIVALTTDPGWIPHLARARGLIIEHGSLLSHSAIVARELGLPTITDVNKITEQLQSGDKITMDGTTGRIEKI